MLVLEEDCKGCFGSGFISSYDYREGYIPHTCPDCKGASIVLTEDGQVVARLLKRLQKEE